MSEPLENEIDEELRRKQLKSLWDRFGLYLISIIVIIILSFGGYEFSNYLARNSSESASDFYQKALEANSDSREEEAKEIFNSLVNEKNGYSGLSLFNLANISYDNGQIDDALDYLVQASENNKLSKNVRNFAILRSGYIMLENHKITVLEENLSSLLEGVGPFSFYAKEIVALAYFRDNNYLESSKKFNEIANDASSPKSISSRAKIFADQISSYNKSK